MTDETNTREWNPVGDGTPLNVWLETRREGESGTNVSFCRLMSLGDDPEWIDRDGYSTLVNPGTFAPPSHWRWPLKKNTRASTSPAGMTEEVLFVHIKASMYAAVTAASLLENGAEASKIMDPIAIDCARTIIDRLASAPSQAETRRKALEEAAKWHNQQEENNRAAMASASHSNSGDHIVAMYRYIAQTHANSAERIRSLATGEPA